MLYMRSVH